MNVKRMALGIAALGSIGFLAACDSTTQPATQTNKDVAVVVGQQQKIYNDNQPFGVFDYSAQRDVLIQIEHATIPELRPTWHVMMSEMGVPIDSCAGYGAPIPYESQITNPEYVSEWGYNAAGPAILPQPEPNGLYNYGGTEATWILCDFGNGIEPVYSEANVQTYFHPVHIQDGKIIHDTSATPSFTVTSKDRPADATPAGE